MNESLPEQPSAGKEASQAPRYLEPTIALVNNTLGEMKGVLLRQITGKEDLTNSQKKLAVLLFGTIDPSKTASLHYNSVTTTASSLREQLDPLSTENLGYDLDSRFKRFVGDLEYVGLLERGGGVEAINGKIRELKEELQKDIPIEQKREAAGRLNDILSRAIYLFPHLAKGVEVRLKPGTAEKAEEFDNKFYDSYRFWHEKLADVYQKEKG